MGTANTDVHARALERKRRGKMKGIILRKTSLKNGRITVKASKARGNAGRKLVTTITNHEEKKKTEEEERRDRKKKEDCQQIRSTRCFIRFSFTLVTYTPPHLLAFVSIGLFQSNECFFFFAHLLQVSKHTDTAELDRGLALCHVHSLVVLQKR